MQVRIFPLLFATLVLALWPQSLVLCFAECGHVEIELAGSPCCPAEEGDCGDCIDVAAPDLRSAPVAVAPTPDLTVVTPAHLSVLESGVATSVLPCNPGDQREGTVLLI